MNNEVEQPVNRASPDQWALNWRASRSLGWYCYDHGARLRWRVVRRHEYDPQPVFTLAPRCGYVCYPHGLYVRQVQWP